MPRRFSGFVLAIGGMVLAVAGIVIISSEYTRSIPAQRTAKHAKYADKTSEQINETYGSVDSIAPTSLWSRTDLVLTQNHFHWRNDDGAEANATSATEGSEDSPLTELEKLTTKRVRIEVVNRSSSPQTASLRLDYGLKDTTCEVIQDWQDVGATGGAFEMSNSPHISGGSNTTNIPVEDGGVSDDGETFKTPNNAIAESSSQLGNLDLAPGEFVEAEFSIEATASAESGGEYCLRVSDSGSPLSSYKSYAQVTITSL